MKQIVWTEEYKVSSFLVNLQGRIGLYSVLNLIQDVGWMHAFHLQVMLPRNHAWVFTRQRLLMNAWPAWNESLRVRTWIRPPQERFLLRDYELFLEDQKIGECTSTFAVIDTQTRKLAAINWREHADVWRHQDTLSHVPEKISVGSSFQEIAQFQVRNSDIDMNQHVNNTKYAQWILDSLPLDVLKGGVDLNGYEVNFIAEARSGDLISLGQAEISDSSEKTTTQFQGTRVADGKVIFIAQLDSTR